MPRDLPTLILDRETPDTIQSALDELAYIEKHDPKWAAATRAELQQELRTLKGQGSLF